MMQMNFTPSIYLGWEIRWT